MFSNLGARLDRFSKTEVADVDGSSRLNCTRDDGPRDGRENNISDGMFRITNRAYVDWSLRV